jgi:hypothetical protein
MEVFENSVPAACSFEKPTIQTLEFSSSKLLPRLMAVAQPSNARLVLIRTFATL